MIKQLALITTCVMVSAYAYAQAYEGKVKYGKEEEPAIVMTYDYPQKIVESALIAKLTDKQLNGTLNKLGFYEYPDVVLPDISKSKLDYYFKLEETGNSNAKKTTLYMIMHGSGDIEGIGQLATRAKTFLENMSADVKRSNTIAAIKKQELLLVEEEEKLFELRKQQQELEEKLAAHKAKVEAQQKIVNSQKMLVEDLKKQQ
ncbi:hypothetical protein PIECOFPK_00647 [Mycovorax composti]|jgi:hypothetical protein|uniref:Uncharacterized protein n=2 Tax=Chitinophagaceae TaxID=563835 RepID=A0ABZ2EHZ9_9BACT